VEECQESDLSEPVRSWEASVGVYVCWRTRATAVLVRFCVFKMGAGKEVYLSHLGLWVGTAEAPLCLIRMCVLQGGATV